MTVIVDYKTGNLSSIGNMLKRIGYEATITCDPLEIEKAEKIILPGVGHYDFGMRHLNELGLTQVLNQKVLVNKTPILGICLGVQLLMKGSDEGTEPGLGWIKGFTRKFDIAKFQNGLKIPHMGWSEIDVRRPSNLFHGFHEEPRFYFVHSYHLDCDHEEDALGYCHYGYPFVAAVQHENISGVQFHPEKSHRFGMQFLKNFLDSV
jgi:imidazole glycerol-phosphate synthase subunit HisH